MKLLLDTHLLVWIADASDRLSDTARNLVGDPSHQLHFSVASIWEIAIKHAANRKALSLAPGPLRRSLLDSGFVELAITSGHVLQLTFLPRLHKDPFDRMLVAQSQVEDITLLTADQILATYPGPIQKV